MHLEGTVQGFADILYHMNARLCADDQPDDAQLQSVMRAVKAHDDRVAHRKCIETSEALLMDGRTYLGGDKHGVIDFEFLALMGQYPVNGEDCQRIAALISRLSEKFLVVPSGSPIPRVQKGLICKLLGHAKLAHWVARIAARFAPIIVTVRNDKLVFRWADVLSVCEQDDAFTIALVNQSGIESVSGRFFLGLDRTAALFQQCRHLYRALRPANMSAVRLMLGQAAEQLTAVEVVNSYTCLISGRVAVVFFDISRPSEADLLRVVRAVLHETFLKLGGDSLIPDTAVATGKEVCGWIKTGIAVKLVKQGIKTDVNGRLLLLVDAEKLTEDEAANTVAGLLIGAIDATATCVAGNMTELVSDLKLLDRVQLDRADAKRLSGWCQEILRRWPQNPLVVREAAESPGIAGRAISSGNKAFAITLSAMQNSDVFDHPSQPDPMRVEKNYMHFSRGLHICSGRDMNAIHVTLLVGKLLQCEATLRGNLKSQSLFPDELVNGLQRAVS